VQSGTLEVRQQLRLRPQQPQQTVEVVYSAAARTHHCMLLTFLIMIPRIKIYVDMKTALHWLLRSIQPRESSQISVPSHCRFEATWQILGAMVGGTMHGLVETSNNVSPESTSVGNDARKITPLFTYGLCSVGLHLPLHTECEAPP
jgi:hypothetical protein